MISANGGLPAHRYTPQVTPRWPRGSELASVCECWLVGCVMVESRCSVLLVGVVIGGRGASWCGQPGGRRSRFHPWAPGWFDVGRLACGLFTVRLRLQLRCGLCAVVLAVSSSAGFV